MKLRRIQKIVPFILGHPVCTHCWHTAMRGLCIFAFDHFNKLGRHYQEIIAPEGLCPKWICMLSDRMYSGDSFNKQQMAGCALSLCLRLLSVPRNSSFLSPPRPTVSSQFFVMHICCNIFTKSDAYRQSVHMKCAITSERIGDMRYGAFHT